MIVKRIIGIVMAIGGIALMLVSAYIKSRVEEGKQQITSAQKKVDTGSGLFSLHPIAKEIGQGVVIDPAQKKLDEANLTVAHYEQVAGWCQKGGIALLVLGVGVIFIGRRKKSHGSR
jgi:hypothetical protein